MTRTDLQPDASRRRLLGGTAALGALYSEGPWSASLIYKRTGAVRQKDFDASKAAIGGVPYFDYYEAPAYGNVDFGVAYTLKNPGAFGKAG